MQLKSVGEIRDLVKELRLTEGVAAAVEGDQTATHVALICAPLAAAYTSVSAISWQVIFLIASQLLPIIFPDGGQTLERLTAIIQIISSIFTV